MKLFINQTGYQLFLTAQETEDWATRPGAEWPCSTLRGRRVRVDVDANGLNDYAIDGGHNVYLGEDMEPQEPDEEELRAIVGDFTENTDAVGFWPLWK
jgi:hypothetical protein